MPPTKDKADEPKTQHTMTATTRNSKGSVLLQTARANAIYGFKSTSIRVLFNTGSERYSKG